MLHVHTNFREVPFPHPFLLTGKMYYLFPGKFRNKNFLLEITIPSSTSFSRAFRIHCALPTSHLAEILHSHSPDIKVPRSADLQKVKLVLCAPDLWGDHFSVLSVASGGALVSLPRSEYHFLSPNPSF